MTDQTLTLHPVDTKAEFAEFINLPHVIYRDVPGRYVPPVRQQLTEFWKGKGPYAKQGPFELRVVRNAAGDVVARTSLHRNAKFNEKLGRELQLFGFTEFVNDELVARFLFDAITDEARRTGCVSSFGPVGLLPNQAGGVITSGYDERGFIDSAYNPAYYPGMYESLGFQRRFEAATWICENLQARAASDVPGELYRFDDARMASEELVLHRGNKRKVGEQLPLIHDMLNASFMQLGYYTYISMEELAHQTDGLNFLLDEDLLLYVTKAGAPIAFVLVIPDISEFVMQVDANLNLPNQLKLLMKRKQYRREAVLIIKGTVPEAQGKHYMNLLSRELLAALQRNGYETLRSTFVEPDNGGSAAQYVKMGGRELHGYTFYERAVTT